jgi:hypothetical protein
MEIRKRVTKAYLVVIIAFAFSGCTPESSDTDDGNSSLINGGWFVNLSSGTAALVTINGNGAAVSDCYDVSCLSSQLTWVSAIKNGVITAGTPYLKNIQSRGNKKWTCLMIAIEYNSTGATGLQYLPATLTLSDDNLTISLAFDSDPYHPGTLSKNYIDNGCSGETATKTGTLAFWTRVLMSEVGSIQITVDNVKTGTLTNSAYGLVDAPTCQSTETVFNFYDLTYGTHTFECKSTKGDYIWSGSANINADCNRIQLTLTNK